MIVCMNIVGFLQIAAAVIVGNAASFAFFMAAMKASKEQKAGKADHELPRWVYAGFIAPIAMVGIAGWMLA